MKRTHTFPAHLDQLTAISTLIKNAALTLPAADPDMFAYEIELAVHEACVNIIEHTNSDTITVETLTEATSIQITLIDQGVAFDPAVVPVPDLSIPQEGGYGLFLIHQLMDSTTYHTRDGKNYLILQKSIVQELCNGN